MLLAEVPDDDLHAVGLVAMQWRRLAPNRLADTASHVLQPLLAVLRAPALAESEGSGSLADAAEDPPVEVGPRIVLPVLLRLLLALLLLRLLLL